MHPKLFASLLEVIENWSADSCETREWEHDSAWWPDNGEMSMATAAAAVYDAIVSTSRLAESELKDEA
jgi:hypothetical protein